MAVKAVASILKTSENEVEERTQAVISDNKEMEKEIQALNAEITKLKSADMFSNPIIVDGLELYIAKIEVQLLTHFVQWVMILKIKVIM